MIRQDITIYLQRHKIRIYIVYIVLILLFSWQFLFAGKGIDGSDAAACLANYKWAFRVPDIVQAGDFFSTLTGALLYFLLPSAPMLTFRILDALFNCAVYYLTLQIIQEKNNILIPAAMLGGSLMLKRSAMLLSYNTFSTFLFSLAMYQVLVGLQKKTCRYLFFAGFTAGINVMFRLPNLLQASIVFTILLYGWKSGWNRKYTRQLTITFIIGYICATLIGLSIGILYKGWTHFLAGYVQLANMGASSSSVHGIGNMLNNLWMQFVSVKKWVLIAFLGAGALAILKAVSERIVIFRLHSVKRLFEILTILAGGLYGVFLTKHMHIDYFFNFLATISILTGVISLLFLKHLDAKQLTWSWFLVISVFCISLGTSNGFTQYTIFGAPILGLTVALLDFWRKQDWTEALGKLTKFLRLNPFCTTLLTMLLTSSLLFGTKLLNSFTYRDASFEQLTVSVAAPELAGMSTTSERAVILDTFYKDMQNPDFSGYPLATVGHFSIGYIICNNPPFFGRTWPDLDSYPTAQYTAKLESQKRSGIFPIIAVVDIGDNSGLFTSDSAEEKYNMLMELAEQEDYICIRNDVMYKLYVPPDCVKKG